MALDGAGPSRQGPTGHLQRVPPHDTQSEENLLGDVLITADASANPRAETALGARSRPEERPERATNTPGVADHLLRGIDVPNFTCYSRFAVRFWLYVASWAERRLVVAYDRLVDVEGKR